MGFYLKHAISAFLTPASIGFILTFIGLIFLFKARYTKAKWLLFLAFTWLYLFSLNPIANSLISGLERQYQPLEKPLSGVKYILVLGGSKELRCWEALRLYHSIDGAKIITSGFEGKQSQSEAKLAAELLMQSGVKGEDIILHVTPRDTKEEAISMKKDMGSKAFYLVTSAYHMPRAMALFKKEGLHPIAAPSDFKAKVYDTSLLQPSGRYLQISEIAWHEYLGLLWSTLRGEI